MSKKVKEPKIVMNRNRYLELLLYITILGAALRFYQLGFNSLWLDEAVTYANVNTNSIATVLTNVYNDHHAPLFFVSVWLLHFVGSSEFWLRIPSAIAGIATIIVVYFLGKEVVNEKVGLFAALLLAVSSYHIFYSQEARMYTFTTLFVTLAYYLFFKASKSGEGRYWILMWLSCAAAFYTHFYTGFVTITLAIGYFLLKNRKSQEPIYFYGGSALAFLLVLPILASFRNQASYLGGQTYGWGLPAIMIPFATLQSFSFQNQFVAAIFLLLIGLGFWLVYQKEKMLAVTLGLFLIVPLLISMLMAGRIPFNIRYHIYLLPLFLVVVSIAIERLSHIWKNRNGTYAAVFLILLCAVITLPPYYSSFTKEDWRGFSQELTKITYLGDEVVVIPGYMQIPLTHYYSNYTDGTVLIGANNVGDLQNITSDKRIFYVVTNDILMANPNGAEMRWLQQNTKPVAQHTGIYLFYKERAP